MKGLSKLGDWEEQVVASYFLPAEGCDFGTEGNI